MYKRQVLLATQTFEYELYLCNEDIVVSTYQEMHPRTDLEFPGTCEEKALAFVKLIKRNKDKAPFSQSLSYKINSDHEIFQEFVVPAYIRKAILWVIDGNSD